jgi:hypothetical protein
VAPRAGRDDLRHPSWLGRLHAQLNAVAERDLCAGQRDAADAVHDESADGVVRVLIGLLHVGQVEEVPEVVHAHGAVDPERDLFVGLDRLHEALLAVVLVLDFPDDLLDHVLHGDQPRGPAVLVDHDCDVALLCLHVVQELVDRLGLGDVDRGPQQASDVEGAVPPAVALEVRQQVLGVEHADDVVEALLEHW